MLNNGIYICILAFKISGKHCVFFIPWQDSFTSVMTREGTCQSLQSRALSLDVDSKQWLYFYFFLSVGLTFFHFSEEEQSGSGVAYIDFREHF